MGGGASGGPGFRGMNDGDDGGAVIAIYRHYFA
jgi:hypothetical protein